MKKNYNLIHEKISMVILFMKKKLYCTEAILQLHQEYNRMQ